MGALRSQEIDHKSMRKRPNQHFPPDFHMNCILEIAIGVGFESMGQPVKYGASIRLVLTTTSEFMRADGDQVYLDSTTSSHMTKDFYFKIKSRYRLRNDGDVVHYGDAVYICDLMNRHLIVDINGIYLAEDGPKKSPFRFHCFRDERSLTTSLVSLNQRQRKPELCCGSVIQLLHRENNHLFTANAIIHATTHDKYNHVDDDNEVFVIRGRGMGNGTSDTDFASFWQLEVPMDSNSTYDQSHSRLRSVTGTLAPFRLIRIRHVLSGRYLSCIDGHHLGLILDCDEKSLFRIIPATYHTGSEEIQKEIFRIGDEYRIIHHQTSQYVVATKHPTRHWGSAINEADTVGTYSEFSVARSDFEGDVFQALAVSVVDIRDMRTAQSHKHFLKQALARLVSERCSVADRSANTKGAIDCIHKLSVHAGLPPKTAEDHDRLRSRQQVHLSPSSVCGF